MCERYREALMGLLDNEIPEAERRDVELHLHECPDCQAEYREFQRLASLTNSLKFPEPSAEVWDHYYDGVCRRMRRVGPWFMWGGISVALLLAAQVLFFLVPASPITIGTGVVALIVGALLLWTTFACNC